MLCFSVSSAFYPTALVSVHSRLSRNSGWRMCASSGADDERQAATERSSKSGVPNVAMGRRGALGNFLKGAGAVVAGEAIMSEIIEAGAVRGAAGLASEEALAAAEGAAVVEGAAALRNGQVVMGEMEKQIFGEAITKGLL